MQQRHRYKIQEIYTSSSSRIDNRLQEVLLNSPRSKIMTGSIYKSSREFKDIDRKNERILDRLTKLARTPVVLKTLQTAKSKPNTRKYFLKKLENNKIHHENLQFARRLVKTTSAFSFKKYEADFQNSQKYCNIRKKIK